MKKIFVSFLLVFSFLIVSAQSRSKKADIEVIKNDPSLVAYVARQLAQLRGITEEEAQQITFENAKRLYRIG